MVMIRAVVRPEKAHDIMAALLDAGFPAITKMDVVGRGKQRGLKVGEITYDELSKEMLLIAVKDEEQENVINIIMKTARTAPKGMFGDGKIFISKIEESYTISTGAKDEA